MFTIKQGMKKAKPVLWNCRGFLGYKSNKPEDIDRRRQQHAETLATAKLIEMGFHTLTTFNL
jgi:hypothetical protein